MSQLYIWGKIISPSFTDSVSGEEPEHLLAGKKTLSEHNQSQKEDEPHALLYRKNVESINFQNSQSSIKSVKLSSSIKHLSCGMEHVVFCTESNQIYAFGSNLNGQMGLAFTPYSQLPISKVFVPSKKKIVSISCGWEHTLILDQAGDVFSTGLSSPIGKRNLQSLTIGDRCSLYDQTVHDSLQNKQNSYGFRHILSGAKKISAGKDHSLAIKGTKVFGWGSTQDGQLGLHSKKVFISPKELNVYPCIDVHSGAKYSIFVTTKGLYGCGLNSNYQLGIGHNKNVHYVKKLNLEIEYQNISRIWCSNYCVVESTFSEYHIWGTGAFGEYKYPTKIDFFQGSENFSLGHSFGIAQKNQKIYVWGSNRFGQLGVKQQFDPQQNSKYQDFAIQCRELSALELSKFQCGHNFAVGFTNDCNSNGYGFRQQNYMKKSSLTGVQNPKCLYFTPEQQFELTQQRLDKNSQNSSDKTSKTSSESDSKSLTIKRQQHPFHRNQQNQQNPSKSDLFSKGDIQRLQTELQQLKEEVLEHHQKSSSLTIQNEQLKIMLKEELLKQVQVEQGFKSLASEETQFQNFKLKDRLKRKERKLENFRKDYNSISRVMEGNMFLRNLLGMQNTWSQVDRDWKNSDKKMDNFGKDLSQLNQVLSEMNHS